MFIAFYIEESPSYHFAKKNVVKLGKVLMKIGRENQTDTERTIQIVDNQIQRIDYNQQRHFSDQQEVFQHNYYSFYNHSKYGVSLIVMAF